MSSQPGADRSPVVVRQAAPADDAAVRALLAGTGLPLDGLPDAAVVLVGQDGDAVVGRSRWSGTAEVRTPRSC